MYVFKLPRAEAVTLMGSLLSYPNAFPNMPLHQPGHPTNEYQPTSTGKDIKVSNVCNTGCFTCLSQWDTVTMDTIA